jgi:beta-lactamase superfamily II metal-dependent hydrolase
MLLRVFDVEHGACAMLAAPTGTNADALAMIDCGHNNSTGWRPSHFIRRTLQRGWLDYLLITNADQDHISDLATLITSGISVRHLMSNTQVSPQTLQWIKRQAGPVTADAEALINMRVNYGPSGSGVPFNQAMGGITVSCFFHTLPAFANTNDLSCAFFITFGSFRILFPGDLEKPGWRAHLQNQTFLTELCKTTILVASHHGRQNGFCEEVFQYLQPQAVVISDKSLLHDSQETVPDYRSKVRGEGIIITNEQGRRQVLTTRNDGDMLFRVELNGNYTVTTKLQQSVAATLTR